MRDRLTLLILVAVLAMWSAISPPPAPSVAKAGPISTDVALYRAIVARVHAGDGYYAAATELQRANNYPLKPFFVVRLPTLTWILAKVGELAGLVTLWGLLAITATSWYSILAYPDRVVAVGLAVFAGASIISPPAVYMTEVWAGLLLSLALSLHRRATWCLAAATAALAFRELALLFLLVLVLSWTTQHRRWPTACAIATIITFAVAFIVHGLSVNAFVRNIDPSSQGWGALPGPSGFLDSLRILSFLRVLPTSLAAALAFIPLLGWYEWGRRDGYLAFGWFSAFVAVIATVARAENFYWLAMMLPGYFIGFVFVPAFFTALVASVRSRSVQDTLS
jgi:hypothetical protein